MGFSGDSTMRINGLSLTVNCFTYLMLWTFLTNLYVNGDFAPPNLAVGAKGTMDIARCHIMQNASSMGQGATVSVEMGG